MFLECLKVEQNTRPPDYKYRLRCGCSILLVAALFDMGVSAVVCALVAASAVAVLSNTETQKIYTEIYNHKIDPKCLAENKEKFL